MRRILVATDFSPGGDRAFDRGIMLSRQTGARLHVLHVLPDLIPRWLQASRAAAARSRIHARLAEIAPDRPDTVAVDVLSGDRAARIVRHAEDIGADLTIIGCTPTSRSFSFLRPIRRRVLCDGLGALLVVRDDVQDYYRRTVFAGANGADFSAAATAVRKIVPNTSVDYVRAGSPSPTRRAEAAARVIDAKQEKAADLVAVSVKRQDSFLRVPLRSLALALVGHAACDTLVVPAG